MMVSYVTPPTAVALKFGASTIRILYMSTSAGVLSVPRIVLIAPSPCVTCAVAGRSPVSTCSTHVFAGIGHPPAEHTVPAPPNTPPAATHAGPWITEHVPSVAQQAPGCGHVPHTVPVPWNAEPAISEHWN